MGVLNSLLNFGNSKGGKVISWVLVGMATFVFFVGILITSLGAATTHINSISLTASNMRWDSVPHVLGSWDGYHLNAVSRQTHITVDVDPINSSVPVTFSTESPFIRFESNRVLPGSTAIMNLVAHQGVYMFGGTDAAPEIVTVTSGNQSATIFVRIALDPAEIDIRATLQRNLPWAPNHWLDAEGLDMRHFDANYAASAYVRYRVHLTATIFGNTLYDTSINPEHFRFFGFEEIDRDRLLLNIGLFGDGTSRNIHVDPTLRIPENVSLSFKVWFTFDPDDPTSEKFLTRTDLSLRIIGWIG